MGILQLGQTDPNSTFNLAKQQIEDVWEGHFFYLRNFGTGFCYTYNPQEMTEVEFKNRLSCFLDTGNPKKHAEIS